MSFLHKILDGLAYATGTIGMIVGGALGAALYPLIWLGTKIFKGRFAQQFRGFRHTILASALGWGAILTAFDPPVRLQYVGGTIGDAARILRAQPHVGDKIYVVDCVPPPPGSSVQIASVAASWGLQGTLVDHVFAGKIITIPYVDVVVPAGACSGSQGELTVTPGIAGALPATP